MATVTARERSAAVERKARDLLDALDRQHGVTLSHNVTEARAELRRLLPAAQSPADRAERIEAA